MTLDELLHPELLGPELIPVDLCGAYGCSGFAPPLHRCPYEVDINDNPDTLCNCCEDCTQECADNI